MRKGTGEGPPDRRRLLDTGGGIDLVDAVTASRQSLGAEGTPAWICRACRKVIADY